MQAIFVSALWLSIIAGFVAAIAVLRSPIFVRGRKAENGIALTFLVIPVFIYGLYLVGFRPEDAGNDTPHYVRTFLNLDGPITARSVGAQYYGNTELLIWPFQSLLKPFVSVRGWLVANYCIVFFLFFLYYRKVSTSLNTSPAIFSLVFLTFFLVYSGNTMRQALAVPVAALALCLYPRQRVLSWIIAVIAIGFHWSAIVVSLAPVVNSRIFNKNPPYLILPLGALGISTLAPDLLGWLLRLLNVPELTDRFDLYFSPERVSHVGQVWTTANFWICILTSFGFLAFCKPTEYLDKSIHRHTVLFLTIMLFGVTNADFSERYMPYILAILPLQLALIVDKFRWASASKSLVFSGYFILLGILVLMSPSSQYTLGYTL